MLLSIDAKMVSRCFMVSLSAEKIPLSCLNMLDSSVMSLFTEEDMVCRDDMSALFVLVILVIWSDIRIALWPSVISFV